MFAAPPVIETEVFATVPENLRVQRGHGCFLEGPSFDREGNLYVVNIPHGQIFKITPDGSFSVVAEYDGEPNGLKIHRDGRIFIADHKHGVMVLDPASGKVTTLVDRPHRERFKGLNDLVFASNGDLFFTDQGESGLQDPTGRLWLLRQDRRLVLLLDNVPSPNGLVVTDDERVLMLAVTRANAIWRVPLHKDDSPGRVGLFIQLSGGGFSRSRGGGGPDGLALDKDGNLAIAHAGMGSVWLFSPLGRPLAEVRSCRGLLTTNIAFGGPDGRTLYITESETASILTARMPVPGRPMFSHLD